MTDEEFREVREDLRGWYAEDMPDRAPFVPMESEE